MNTEITDVNARCSPKAAPPCSAVNGRWMVAVTISSAVAVAFALAAALGAWPPWVGMWLIALAISYAGKSLTLLRFPRLPRPVSALRFAAYLFLWPGMNAKNFLATAANNPKPAEWITAIAKIMAGSALLWIVARLPGSAHPLATGWLGMTGLVVLLHFGLFHLVSVAWRRLGVNAAPLMNAPAAATSLAGFWGGRWNTAFSDLMHIGSRPLVKRFGKTGALLAVFFISGILHELVLTFPARAGYGLPTLYFMLQAASVLFEQSPAGKRLGLGSSLSGWCFVALAAGLPAFLLFNPLFVYRIVLPMLNAIGAT